MAKKFFGDINVGDKIKLTPITLSREIRDAHVALYEEGWSMANIDREEAIPLSLLVSITDKSLGRTNWPVVSFCFLVGYKINFYNQPKIGDELVIEITVREKKEDERENLNFGWILLSQVVSVGEKTIFMRDIKCLAKKR